MRMSHRFWKTAWHQLLCTTNSRWHSKHGHYNGEFKWTCLCQHV